MTEELSIDKQQVDDHTAVVIVSGELELANCAALRETVVELLAQSVTHLALDLTGLSFIDSSGVGVVIGALKRVRERNGVLTLAVTGPAIRRVFEITGLTEVFSIFPSREEALAGLRKEGSP